MKFSISVFFACIATFVTAAMDWPTQPDANMRMVDYYDVNVNTNHPAAVTDYPWTIRYNDSTAEQRVTWTGDAADEPTQAEYNAADPVRGKAIRDNAENDARHGAGSSGVRDHAASNIVVLASAYGVTDQPISWAAVATAMQVERIDATASNDVMRLLTVIGDGTTLLSFKEFYTENGGDVFNVTWP